MQVCIIELGEIGELFPFKYYKAPVIERHEAARTQDLQCPIDVHGRKASHVA
jgi:hypothetical protein